MRGETSGDAELCDAVLRFLEHDSEPTGLALDAAMESAGDEEALGLPQVIGPYRILGLLGRGRMGVVYEAEQDSPPRRVALKVLRPDLVTSETLRRFEKKYAPALEAIEEALAICPAGHPDLPMLEAKRDEMRARVDDGKK